MGFRGGMGLTVMNKKTATPSYFPQADDSSTEDDLVKKMRARRLAEMLNRDAQAPIDYDPRGAISSGQLMAKALANAGSIFANQQQDREQARGMIEQNRQEQAMFSGDGGFGGNPLAGNMTGEQARFLRATNPEKWAEMVAHNARYTDPMKNANAAWGRDAGGYMQQDQMADLRKKQLIEMGEGQTLFDTQMDKPLFTTNKTFNQDLGNRKDIVGVNPQTGKAQTIRSDSMGVDPTTKYRTDNAPERSEISKAPSGYRFTADGNMEPIPGGPADLKARALEEQKSIGASDVDLSIGILRDAYDRLEKGGGITSTEKGALSNVGAAISSGEAGQAVGRMFGTDNQSARNDIAMSRPALLAALMKATGMSAKQMDSNAELKLWLATATDPKLDVEANRRALDNIEAKYMRGRQDAQIENAGDDPLKARLDALRSR
jgi:hypothetical protein